jgi:hypothetical protein
MQPPQGDAESGHQPDVEGAVAAADTTVVLAVDDIQDPVRLVLEFPRGADGLGDKGRVGPWEGM